jgi:hypothetical protein
VHDAKRPGDVPLTRALLASQKARLSYSGCPFVVAQ